MPRRRRSRFLSLLLCTSTVNRRNVKKRSPPRRSVLEYDDDESITNETVKNGGRLESRGSFKGTHSHAHDYVESGPVWSVGSLASRFQHTPSPVCSTCSPVGSESTGSGGECSFSTPKNLSPTKVSFSSVDIDDWVQDGKKRPFRQNSQSTREDGKRRMSCSSVYESAIDQLALASIHEEETNVHDEEESPFLPYHKLLSRPKPYHEFLSEVEKQENESKVHALHNDHIEKLRKREAAVREWEVKQTRKRQESLRSWRIGQSKQKRELAKALEKLQQKMSRIQSKVAEKKAKGRLSCVSDDADIYSSVMKHNI